MTIDVLDYSGHPCQAQLSRALAARGHEVRHLHCPDYVSGKGSLERTADDPDTYTVQSVTLGAEFERYSPFARIWQEFRFGSAAARLIRRRGPDVALLSNVPLIADFILTHVLVVAGVPIVFWQQDIYSNAITVNAEKRLGAIGHAIGLVSDRAERAVAQRSSGVITIADDFVSTLQRWKVPDGRITVIPNWAPIDELPLAPKRNNWSVSHDLADRYVMLYSGTLGLKHDPSILRQIAHLLRAADPEARLVVVSQGSGRAWLEHNIGPDFPQLVFFDYQRYDVLPEVLATADVLIAILEPAAGVFSVPSKTLSYLCSGRPTLAVMPSTNLAAKIITGVDAGIVVEPGDSDTLEIAVHDLRRDASRRAEMGRNARSYAEDTFDIGQIVERFETRLASAVELSTSTGRS